MFTTSASSLALTVCEMLRTRTSVSVISINRIVFQFRNFTLYFLQRSKFCMNFTKYTYTYIYIYIYILIFQFASFNYFYWNIRDVFISNLVIVSGIIYLEKCIGEKMYPFLVLFTRPSEFNLRYGIHSSLSCLRVILSVFSIGIIQQCNDSTVSGSWTLFDRDSSRSNTLDDTKETVNKW